MFNFCQCCWFAYILLSVSALMWFYATMYFVGTLADIEK